MKITVVSVLLSAILFFTFANPVIAQTPTPTSTSSNEDDSFWAYPGWVADDSIGENYFCTTLDAIQLNSYYYIKWPDHFYKLNDSGFLIDGGFYLTVANVIVKNLGPNFTRFFSNVGYLPLDPGQSSSPEKLGYLNFVSLPGGGFFSIRLCIQKTPGFSYEFQSNSSEDFWKFEGWSPSMIDGAQFMCASFDAIYKDGTTKYYYIKFPTLFDPFTSEDGYRSGARWFFPEAPLYIKNNGPSLTRYYVQNGKGVLNPGEEKMISESNQLELTSFPSTDTSIGPFNVSICMPKKLPLTWSNVINDGDMEEQPYSNFWFPDGSPGVYDGFGRIDSTNLMAKSVFGLPRCFDGFQIVGNWSCDSILDFYCIIGNFQKNYAPVRQRFTWPGGTLYYRFSVRGSPDRMALYNVSIKNMATFTTTVLRSGSTGPADKNNLESWDDISGNAGNIPGGTYDISLGLASGSQPYDVVFFDDVLISDAPIESSACQASIPVETSTPTIVPTPTSVGQAGPNLIENCGFEQGEIYWAFDRPRASVIYDFGKNYAHEETNTVRPGIYQTFYWPGGTAYITWKTDSDFDVYLRNIATRQEELVAKSLKSVSGWVTYHNKVVDLPAGTYTINLHFPAGAGPADYDDITVNVGNYGTCEGGANATPTGIPTATPNATSTQWPTPTQRPTSTVMPGTATPTTRPTYTPYPTFTQWASPYPSITPPKWPTFTPYPTYTRQPTYTPLPTYTPDAAGTIQPSPTAPPTETPPPQQAPPDYYADCNRPLSSTDLAGWQEYEKCQVLSFFSMSPNAVSTVASAPTAFSGAEPFGTFNELKDTEDKVKGLVGSYDWTNTGLPGMKDAPNVDQFTAPAADSPWVTGKFDFSDKGSPTSRECTTAYTTVLGPYLTPPFCFLMNIMREKGILPWIQLLVNIAALGFLVIYLWRKWIDAGAGGD